MVSKKPIGDRFKYIDIESINNKTAEITPKILFTQDAPSRASRQTQKGDILFSMVRPYLRNIAMVKEDDCIASTGFYVFRSSSIINPSYLLWLLRSDYVVNGLNEFMKGDNSPSITKNDIERFMFIVPPINEQKRIVERIEQAFILIDNIASNL
jgi:type I restriction enzyme S subunit